MLQLESEIMKTAWYAASVSFAAMAVLFAVNFALLQITPQHYRSLVTDSARSGALNRTLHLPFAPAKTIFLHSGNDCLILGALAMPRESRIRASVSPRMPVWVALPSEASTRQYPPDGHCQTLASTMDALTRDEDAIEVTNYHRYIHGDITVAALLLGFMSFPTATALMLGSCYAILVIIVLLSLVSLYTGRPEERNRSGGFLIIAAVLAFFYALPIFARSFSFGPTDIVILGFILFVMLRPLGQLSTQRFILLSAAFGSSIAILEFMTGGIPLALATVVALVGLDRYSDWRLLLKRELTGVVAFTSAAIFCFIYKQIAVWALWDVDPFAQFVTSLGTRVGGCVGPALPEGMRATLATYQIDPGWIDANLLTRALFAGAMLLYSSFFLAWGSHILGAILVMLPTAALAYFAVRHVSGEKNSRAIECFTLAAAATVPIVWYLVFLNHTALHSSYMVRPLALNVALFLIASPIFGSFLRSTHRQ